MKFKDFYKKFNAETVEVFKEFPKVAEVQERIVNAWMVYQTIEINKKLVLTTKKLVWATWSLAVATIVLVIVSLLMR